jgi:hypothetical protein
VDPRIGDCRRQRLTEGACCNREALAAPQQLKNETRRQVRILSPRFAVFAIR